MARHGFITGRLGLISGLRVPIRATFRVRVPGAVAATGAPPVVVVPPPPPPAQGAVFNVAANSNLLAAAL